MLKSNNIEAVINLIKKECEKYNNAIVTEIGDITKNPFKVLISCLLSLRTKDAVTAIASRQLFKVADTPEKILRLNTKQIEKLIYPVGFYKTKARRIKEICKVLIKNYSGKVPDNEEELLKLKGVGRKTMNIVMTYGFHSKNHIAVDTHVHRIPNRLGWIKTKKPDETEKQLLRIIPKEYYHDINDLFVVFGQNICVPISPFCSKCPVKKYCHKINIKKHR
ncbi:endonuclease III [Candidatus Woesearchaeota archaeon]|nr:endonuclease III [Candidatus Woesearchaeota archaeon]